MFAVADGYIYTSKDGLEWKKMEGLEGDYSSIEFGNGIFLALGKKDAGYNKAFVSAVSKDGIHWTETQLSKDTHIWMRDPFFVKDSFWIPWGDAVYSTTDG
jgi:hypothetical protein